MSRHPEAAGWRLALPLILAGLPGIASLLLVMPEVPGVPRGALLLNPLLILVGVAFLGAWAAPRCGYRAWQGDAPARGRVAVAAVGFALGLAIAGFDHLARGAWQAEPGRAPSLVEGWSAAGLAVGVLYGGVVEEVIARWGLMSLAVLALWRLGWRTAGAPPAAAVVAGNLVAALAFAAAHLPVLFAGGAEPTMPLLVRTLALNALAGLAFGWIFARRDLVDAIAAHAAAHGGFAAVAAVFRA
jgi:hypothetical protein